MTDAELMALTRKTIQSNSRLIRAELLRLRAGMSNIPRSNVTPIAHLRDRAADMHRAAHSGDPVRRLLAYTMDPTGAHILKCVVCRVHNLPAPGRLKLPEVAE